MAASSRFATVSEDDCALKCFFLFFEIITCVFIFCQFLFEYMHYLENLTYNTNTTDIFTYYVQYKFTFKKLLLLTITTIPKTLILLTLLNRDFLRVT